MRSVVHELDGLKKEDDATGQKARLAIRFIDDVQTAKEKWIRIQSNSEIFQNISHPYICNSVFALINFFTICLSFPSFLPFLPLCFPLRAFCSHKSIKTRTRQTILKKRQKNKNIFKNGSPL